MSSFNKTVNDIFGKIIFSISEPYKRPQSNFLFIGFKQQMKRKRKPGQGLNKEPYLKRDSGTGVFL